MNELNPASKIIRRQAINKASPVAKSAKTVSSKGESEDRVTLSVASKVQASKKSAPTSGELRMDLVNKFKSVLEKGSYDVKADEIADKMVQKIREQKNQVIF
ncbi:MAG: flagellar biosynthesis anti-sigma factor FlgM [Candidatus Nitrohelix vancouverensis]|uniref:Flagellar biosynthesis anti-sigma factor FlgM n=1 Tax=Candidatus Nitrohelix vancouverensis TaxID=2705534 RepID=A0A7T0G437_9BACT|nr:MAG: flagellar biosynthesis anti-sigma factor FlgM [Candidatus Nitrohelix vancouverensis]